MSYKSTSIKGIVEDIERNKVFLPALQRKFVWGKYQIELLFDSLMRNYPIGTFLFWNLRNTDANHYVFYEFLKSYDQRTPYNNRKQGAFAHPEIIGVLDGQQRLSSMFIGLQGTYTEKQPYMQTANPKAYINTKLYLNVLNLPYSVNASDAIETNEERNFEFRFLSDEDSTNWIYRKVKVLNEADREVEEEQHMFWFHVGDILFWGLDPEFDKKVDGFIEKAKNETQKNRLKESRRLVRKAIDVLYKRITAEPLINYFEVNKTDLEDILKIFIRVNSGGAVLGKTDLLFSTIVATWENGREQIEALQKEINSKGDRFNFSNDYLMRCCLVLTDGPVLFKVNSFQSENVKRIKDNWEQIAVAIRRTVDLLVEFGFNGSLLSSQNATIVIAYYLLKEGVVNDMTKQELKKYLVHALLKGVYGSSQDRVIINLRNWLRKGTKDKGRMVYSLKNNRFRFDEVLKVDMPSGKSFSVTEVELDNFLNYRKSAGSFFVLTLLYPNLRYQEVQFHQDHIHPASGFDDSAFEAFGLSKEQKVLWLERRDTLPNLQLMEARSNESKNAQSFKTWIENKDVGFRNQFFATNHIPCEEALDFMNFIQFYDKRRELLKQELIRVLAFDATAVTIEEAQVPQMEDMDAEDSVDYSVSEEPLLS